MEEISLFKNIDLKDIETTIKSFNGRIIKFKKDMTILSNLNNTNEVGVMILGKSSLIRIDYNGNRTIVSELQKNDLFGGCFSDYVNDEMSVIANTDCEVLFLEYDKLLGKGNKRYNYHEIIIENMIEILVKKINSYNRRIEILNKRTIREKLLEYFHILEKETSSNTFKLPFTFTILAEYLAVDRSAMMREIKNLKDEEIIKIENKIITLIYRWKSNNAVL